ncbi:hypothetical protein ETB97_000609 [Aspergillus alliaceus]|uniref:Uncharacterized protein n=1 Tax=Petromyces alliaceus TaxID=209559 RepID=A0A8H6A1S2_PETAA|nr:hypothetical protein ETB97_000609 [Aspergillus burnettii]
MGLLSEARTRSLLDEKVEAVKFYEKAPEKLVADVRAKLLEVERLAKLHYEKIDASVKKEPLDTLVEKWKGRSFEDIDKIVAEFKVWGMSANTAGVAAASVAASTMIPILIKSFSAFWGTVGGGFLGAAAGLFVTAIIDAIAAENKYHKLEEAIQDLTDTKNTVQKYREQTVTAADNLMLAVRAAKKEAEKSG